MYAIFLDIETTGLDPMVHKAIEIAFKIVDLSTGDELVSYYTVIKQNMNEWNQRDLTSIKINGFDWEKLQTGKEVENVRQEIIAIFDRLNVQRGKFFYICQNPSFDRYFFCQIIPVKIQEEKQWPYHWLDLASMYWTIQVKTHQANHTSLPADLSLSKNAIARNYHLPIEEFPHGALNGVNHLILCYKTVIGLC